LYDNSGTFGGDTIGSLGYWHTGHGIVSAEATEYAIQGNRLSPEHDVSFPGATLISSEVSWEADTFAGTSLLVETRFSTDAGATWSSWIAAFDHAPVPGLLPGTAMDSARLQTRVSMATTALFASPRMYSLQLMIVLDSLASGIQQPPGLQEWSVFPNPFSNSFNMQYFLLQPADVEIAVYSALGIRTVIERTSRRGSGMHQLETVYEADDLAAGLHWIEITVNGQPARKKLVHF
jgi:hypothetical protein